MPSSEVIELTEKHSDVYLVRSVKNQESSANTIYIFREINFSFCTVW